MKKWLLKFEPHLSMLLLITAMIGIAGSLFNIAFMLLTVISIFAWLVLLEVCTQEFIQSHQDF